MARGTRLGTTPARLRVLLGLLLLALVLPSLVLLWQTQRQLRWESLHQHRVLAEELSTRIDLELQRLIGIEEARADGDYRYLTVAASGLVERSPLAQWPPAAAFPGLVGHFVVAGDGRFGTPLLPDPADQSAQTPLAADELARRQARAARMAAILGENRMLAVAPAHSPSDRRADADAAGRVSSSSDDKALAVEYPSQAAFDQLASSRAAGVEQRKNELGNKIGRAHV